MRLLLEQLEERLMLRGRMGLAPLAVRGVLSTVQLVALQQQTNALTVQSKQMEADLYAASAAISANPVPSVLGVTVTPEQQQAMNTAFSLTQLQYEGVDLIHLQQMQWLIRTH